MVFPSTKERTETSRPVINSSMTMVFPALPNFLSSMIVFHTSFCFLQILTDQNTFSKSKSVCFQDDREFCFGVADKPVPFPGHQNSHMRLLECCISSSDPWKMPWSLPGLLHFYEVRIPVIPGLQTRLPYRLPADHPYR